MIDKEKAHADMNAALKSFWESLAYAAPEMISVHFLSLENRVHNIIEKIYKDD